MSPSGQSKLGRCFQIHVSHRPKALIKNGRLPRRETEWTNLGFRHWPVVSDASQDLLLLSEVLERLRGKVGRTKLPAPSCHRRRLKPPGQSVARKLLKGYRAGQPAPYLGLRVLM